MAYQAKDGTPFTNRPMATRHDARNEAAKPLGKVSSSVEPDMDSDEGQDPAAVVEAHGPATQILIKHQEPVHHVKSKHPDGHTHESDHPTAADAHDAARALAGVDQPEEAGDQEPDLGDDSGQSAAPAMKGLMGQ